jgi:hypothetical protein
MATTKVLRMMQNQKTPTHLMTMRVTRILAMAVATTKRPARYFQMNFNG